MPGPCRLVCRGDGAQARLQEVKDEGGAAAAAGQHDPGERGRVLKQAAGWGCMGWRLQRCKAKDVRQQLLDSMTQVRGAEVQSGLGCHCGRSK